MAIKKLDIDEQRALVQTATQLKLKAGEDSRALIEQYGSVANMPNAVKKEYYDLRTVLGDLSPSKARQLAINQIEKQNRENAESGMGRVYKRGTDEYSEAIRLLTEEYLKDFTFAEGGRVGRQMGSPMMGEQPMANPMAAERKDVAMETKGQANDVYAKLRARLPQEIPDEVVRL